MTVIASFNGGVQLAAGMLRSRIFGVMVAISS